MSTATIKRSAIVIRFAGDSGDGMQVTGAQLTHTSALMGNDVQTFPDFPAEIRAPAGTIPGVSGFQLCFSDHDIHTPGDLLDALVAMNPAALRVNIADLTPQGILILNSDSFQPKELAKAKYTIDPREDGSLASYQVFSIPMTDLTLKALSALELSHSQAKKCKNMLALGIICWLYSRPLEPILEWLTHKYIKHPELIKANQLSLQTGYNFAITAELFAQRYEVPKAKLPAGLYRQITGNEAIALACGVAASLSKRPVLLAGYPITPASSILQSATKYIALGLEIFQAEDEIAAICAVMGAAFGGAIGVTCTSGPGLDLKTEGLGLAVMAELPLVVIDVQRAGPSTGMPTKLEQSDLSAVLFGRHGECPLPVLAAATPAECFSLMLEAVRIACKYMTPVILLSDASLSSSAEPWRLPDIKTLPDLQPQFCEDAAILQSMQRDPATLAKPWAIPGTPGLEFRLGGLEKNKASGDISYAPNNHASMVELRAKKIAGITQEISAIEIVGEEQGDILVVGWGSTYGALLTAVQNLQDEGLSITLVHLRYLNPLPKQLGPLLKNFNTIFVPEHNLGQLNQVLRAQYLIETVPYHKVTGKPFLISELEVVLRELGCKNG